MDEQAGVTGTWVKSYDRYGRLNETHGLKLVQEARSEFSRRLAEPGIRFAQWGVKSDGGNIVLGEYQQPGCDHLRGA